ncbi:hypothetical protein BU204_08390 [Actinophytocola xanthii]|uniref:Histidine kinase/HSP90-like ATPase domain-containing protein n=2 Tax=Actinophytocola xanthii TaxID=1912961 RepID=A0A1Q8CUV8_9PSEU|nr:hypothetical protein BU204_08390 [Actinophytocola xanthii]
MWELDLVNSSPGALVEVRRWAAAELADLGDAHLNDVMMVAVELVTNAYDHGDGPRVIRMVHHRTPCWIEIEVDDFNVQAPALGRSRFGPEAHRGRGLVLVDRLSSAWGTREHGDGNGKTVWARISCQESPCDCDPDGSARTRDAALDPVG